MPPVVHGEIARGWGSNAGEFTGRAEVEGALGAFGWNAGAVRRDSGDIETPDKALENTDFEQMNGNVAVGLSGSWGMARVRWAHWEVDTGFYRPVGFRLGLDDDMFAGDAFLPTWIGDLELSASRQANIRQALPAALAGKPEGDLKLVTQDLERLIVGFGARWDSSDLDVPLPPGRGPRRRLRQDLRKSRTWLPSSPPA